MPNENQDADVNLSPEAVYLQRALGLDSGFAPEAVAQALGVNVSTVYRWLQLGKLAGKQFGKQWRISEEDVQKFVGAQAQERERLVIAKRELRRMKKLRPNEPWRIETCVGCGGGVVTDGVRDHEGNIVVVFGGDERSFIACPDQCYWEIQRRLAPENADITPDEIPFE